ncbi:MAG TPA: protein kinase [Planctomycetaceae bacterium]|jgi:serine/threonine protein kinase|nr:protein kinase [Planctomycetaceae bacterium]
MSDHPTIGGSSVSSQSGVLGQPGSQPQFPHGPLQFDEPQTVVNPERRGAAGDSHPSARPEDSSLWARLFPRDAPPVVDGTPSAVGCRLGHFRIEATIGAGGMGAVFRAVDERLDRVVALKVLSPSLSRDSGSIQRFLNEARAAARLDHDNIARVFYIGEDRGLNFIAHEFVTGRTIRDIIRDHGALDPREAVNYALQLATALRHTAAAGVVHRDIKPSNIIITPRGRAKLVDLGLAKKVASESFGDLTIAGTTLGTFDYISPEQAKDPRNVDVRSDIYSLGCTLYHMLAGGPPYPEGTVLQKLLDHQAKGVPDPASKNPRVPPRLSAVVRRMMAPDPRERYATPDELILELLPIGAEMGLRGVNPEGLVWTSHAPQQRSFIERNVVWIAGIAVLALIAFLVDRFPQKTHDRGTPVASRESTDLPELSSPSKPSVAPPNKESPNSGTNNAATSPSENSQTAKTSSPKESSGGILDFKILPAEPDTIFDASPSNLPSGGTPSGPPTARAESPEAAANVKKGSVAPPMPDPPIAPEGQPGKTDNTTEDNPTTRAPEISISDGGESPTPYATLESAVADAKDGSTIELKFNGVRAVSEKPFRISGRRVTIKAGRGYHPVISFSPRELPATGFEGRMIALNNASLDLFDVDVQATVPDATNADHWSLFSFGGPDRLTCRNVNITVTNPGNRQAEIVDISANAPMPSRQPNPMGAPPEFEIELEHCLIRGSCGLFAVRTVEGGRIVVRESALALQGALISNFGDENASSEMRRIALRMEHLSCFLGGGLIQLDGGDVPRTLVPLDVTARNNVFASKSQTPLVVLAGRTKEEEFPRLIRWGDGSHNFYDHFSSYWSVSSPTGESSNMPLNFESWKHLLGDNENDSNAGNIAWTHAWQGKSFASIRKADFELPPESPARAGALDNTDVGADLSLIRSFPEVSGTAALNQTGSHERVP